MSAHFEINKNYYRPQAELKMYEHLYKSMHIIE